MEEKAFDFFRQHGKTDGKTGNLLLHYLQKPP